MSPTELPDGTAIMQLLVNSPQRTLRDLARNGRFIVASFCGLLLYCLISAAAMCHWDQATECATCLPIPGNDRYAMALYATWINVTTVGFGDWLPHTPGARIVACVNALFGLLAMGWIVALIVSALTPSDEAEGEGDEATPNGPTTGWRRLIRWAIWIPRRIAKWVEDGLKGEGRRPKVMTATVRSAQGAERSDALAAAEQELAHVRRSLARERALVDALVNERKEHHERATESVAPSAAVRLAEVVRWIKEYLEDYTTMIDLPVAVHIRPDGPNQLRIIVVKRPSDDRSNS